MVRRTDAYIGLGSNLADPQQQLIQALSALAQIPRTALITQSSLFRSAPMGPQDQPDYLNAVAHISTDLDAHELLDQLQIIETQQGRVRQGERWGARTLDLDLLLFGNAIINDDRLTVPHPGLHERAFVLYPLYEIIPGLVMPVLGTLKDWIAQCPAEGLEKLK